MEDNITEQGTALPLESNLNFAAAKPLATALLEKRREALVIDASSVEHLGASCLQVLISAEKTWREDETSFSVINCSPEFLKSAELFGFTEELFNQQEAA